MSNLSKVQFKYTHLQGLGEHRIEAGEDANAGHLSWAADTGRISEVFVAEDLRRQGIATALLKTAHETAEKKGLVHPEHSDTRTESGDKWVRKVSPNAKPAQSIEKDFY